MKKTIKIDIVLIITLLVVTYVVLPVLLSPALLSSIQTRSRSGTIETKNQLLALTASPCPTCGTTLGSSYIVTLRNLGPWPLVIKHAWWEALSASGPVDVGADGQQPPIFFTLLPFQALEYEVHVWEEWDSHIIESPSFDMAFRAEVTVLWSSPQTVSLRTCGCCGCEVALQ